MPIAYVFEITVTYKMNSQGLWVGITLVSAISSLIGVVLMISLRLDIEKQIKIIQKKFK